MVFLFACTKYYKTRLNFPGKVKNKKITETKVLLWSIFPVQISLHWKILRFPVTRLFKNHQLSSEERHKSPLLFANLIGALLFFQDAADSAWRMAKGCILRLYLYQVKSDHIQVYGEQAGRETDY